MENSLHPNDVRLGPSELHGKRQLLLATLASVKRRYERLLAFRRAWPIELDGRVVSNAKTSVDRSHTLGHLCCSRKFGLEVRS